MRFVLLLLGVLAAIGGCSPAPVPVARVVTCVQVEALALAIVDGRRRGQSRAEQTTLVPQDSPLPSLHRAFITSIYDWPRPTTAAAWDALSRNSAQAAVTYCANRPAMALRGQGGP